MHCPRCGQEQLSQEVRFCSRCGLNLTGVPQLLATGGLVPTTSPTGKALTPRQAGVRLGAKVLFASFVLFPLMLAVSIGVDSPFPLFLAFMVSIAGALRMLYARWFEDGQAHPVPTIAPFAPETPRVGLPSYQPPTQAPSFRSAVTTGELAEPPSVTEHTTRFLDESQK